MKIIIPTTPSVALSPNSRCHWRVKARAAKELRTVAKYCAYSAMGRVPDGSMFDGPVTVRATIAWEPRRRVMDGDNALACLKAAFDGLQDARVIENDRSCRYEPVVQIRDKDKRGSTVIEIEAIPEERAALLEQAADLIEAWGQIDDWETALDVIAALRDAAKGG